MKTADEMFRELKCKLIRKANNTYTFLDENGDAIIVRPDMVCFTDIDQSYEFTVFADEILACAQLIKEMEDSK